MLYAMEAFIWITLVLFMNTKSVSCSKLCLSTVLLSVCWPSLFMNKHLRLYCFRAPL